MNVFLSYAVGELDAPIAARLRAVAAAYEISIVLPDRSYVPNNGLSQDTNAKIMQSDAVLALITRTAQLELLNVVNLELRLASQFYKPIMALIEQGVPFQGIPENQIVYFDRFNPTAHEESLIRALNQLQAERQQWKNNLTALGWIAGITLGLIALSEWIGDKK